MRLPLLVSFVLLLSLDPQGAEAWLPVCKEREETVGNVHVYLRLDCGATARVTVCPVQGDGPCHVVDLDSLP